MSTEEIKNEESAPHVSVDPERTTAHDYGVDPELNAEANQPLTPQQQKAYRLRREADLVKHVEEQTAVAATYQHNATIALVDAIGTAKHLPMDDLLVVMRDLSISLTGSLSALDRLKGMLNDMEGLVARRQREADAAEGTAPNIHYKYAKEDAAKLKELIRVEAEKGEALNKESAK